MQDHPQLLDIPANQTLAAIVFSEAANFNTLMAQDQEHALAMLRRDIHLLTLLCQDFEGEVLKSTGDGLLMYFVSAVGAVACAVEIQKALTREAENLPTQDVLQHRIGIHLGDVFFSDRDVMGNGVNVAARLQAIATPGGICISQTVYDAVKNGLALPAAYLGAKELENIAYPVPVYQVLLSPTAIVGEEQIADVKTYFTREQYRDRQILINKVRSYWISGVLETGLRSRALLALGLQQHLDSLELSPALIWDGDLAGNSLPPETKIIDKFKQLTPRTLLILGEPGAGKTTTLLELTQELLVIAEYDYTQPLPIVFNLSSWQRKQSIADWLVQELQIKYQLSKEIGKKLLQYRQLLLMLDGLDEVSTVDRDACVQAINEFSQEFTQTEMVITSRTQDYEVLSNNLKVQTAVCLQPLTLAQIDRYLTNAGGELAAFKRALQEDVILQELARSPLMLSIISLAYHGKSFEDLVQMYSLEERRQHIFNAYIDRMLKRRSSTQYSRHKAMRWLIWLAKQMNEQSQSVFLIEIIQTSWLPKWHQLFYAIITGIIAGLLCSLAGALNVGMLLDWESAKIAAIVIGLGVGLITALIFGFIYSQINPVEILKWSIKKTRKNLRAGLTVGLISGIIGAGIGGLYYRFVLKVGGWSEGLFFGLRVGIGVAVIYALLRGLTAPTIESGSIPNQGIWQSAKNALIFFLLGATGLGLVAFILGLPILSGAITGLLFGVFGAGQACIKHFALRVVLYCNGYIPLNYARFLNWATEHILLQKVGGGYIFIHRLLLEHFAQMGK